jgi:dipeptidyl aminopeptidase/acylaminoacyl peptidase
MQVWIYRPPARSARRPVILIGAAGRLFGMPLAPDDRHEHLPWARAGYLVVAYSQDGASTYEHEANEAILRRYVRSHAGLDNSRAALAFALATERAADRERIYAVGHSSAATLALRVGAELPEVKAIVAFNGVADVEARVRARLPAYRADDPEAPATLAASSPMNHVAALRQKPVFLFHSRDDGVVPLAESEGLKAALGDRAELLIVPTGGHYDAMIAQGIPAAITWLGRQSGAGR